MREAHNKFTYKYVKGFVEGNSECELISTEYVNATTIMLFKCACGSKFETSFSKFKSRNKRQCNSCSGTRSPTLEEVKDLCYKNGLIPLFDEYINRNQKLLVGTEHGYVFLTTHHQLGKGIRRKPIFNAYNPHTIKNIKTYISNNSIDCEILSDVYESNNRHKLDFRCSCGSEFSVTWNEFYSSGKTNCNECGIKKRSGKNHYEYNPRLTKEERIRRRMVTPNKNMRVFRNGVFERDNYTCVCCGARSGKDSPVTLNAHHLNGYHWYEKGRFDPDNGVTLCSECHENFHEIYGRRNNTKEQFEEYMRLSSPQLV